MQPNVLFRPAHGPADTDALLRVHHLCDAADPPDPVSLLAYRPTEEWYKAELARSVPEDWVVAENAAGEVIGYGHALWDWPERDGTHVFLHLGWVAPEWRGQGVGTGLLAALERRCQERAAVRPATQYEFGANALSADTASGSLLLNNSYTPGYHLLEMEYAATTPPVASPLPEGYELRPVQMEEHLAIWQCIGDAYDVSRRPDGRYQEIASDDGFHRYFRDADADPSLWFVAWRGSRIAGQVLCRLREQCAEIYEVSVGFGHRRKGLAKALMLHALSALHERGQHTVRLYTVRQNPTGAWRLYERVGFRTVHVYPRWRKAFILEPGA